MVTHPVTDKIVPIAKQKIEQILEAGKVQLPPDDYARLVKLAYDLQIYGMTPFINVELGKLMARLQWGLEITESPEWEEALIKCDEAFLGYELRDMFIEMGREAPRQHKKELCRRLYKLGHPSVVAVMEPYIKTKES